MTPCAMVKLVFMQEYPQTENWRQVDLMPWSSSHEGQARVGFFPGIANPDMSWVFGNRERARAPCQKIQVIHIVSGARYDRMESAMYQHDITIPHLQGAIASVFSRIKVLKRESVGLTHPVIVDFVQVHFPRRIV